VGIVNLDELCRDIAGYDLLQTSGKLKSATGAVLTCALPAAVGDLCNIQITRERKMLAEVIGFNHDTAYLVPFEHMSSVRPGMPVIRTGQTKLVPAGRALLGRVLDGLCRPVDRGGELSGVVQCPLYTEAPTALERCRIREPFVTGQRAIDGLLTLGRGQRIGIFAGSGVGKSVLLGEIAKGAESDLNVIALIGERGREVRTFLEDSLGPVGLARSVVVVATSDQSPLMRVRAAQSAITMAHHFREQGANVLFVLDSLTRLAMAQRELGLALGEPPSARGYTPSVFQLLATSLERLGNSARGSITGILTVLVDGGDLDEPISDTVRSVVDGHIILDRRLAERNHYPAISISQSISRISHEITDNKHQAAARKFRAIQATYAEAEDLIRIGAYAKGSDPQIDKAKELMPALEFFLKQPMGERSAFVETRAALERIAAAWPF
jgi:flagellum-specific ATP synthase